MELARHMRNKSYELKFGEPTPSFGRTETRELRAKILSLSQSDASKIGIEKSTLHYIKTRARQARHFRSYQKTYAKLCMIE